MHMAAFPRLRARRSRARGARNRCRARGLGSAQRGRQQARLTERTQQRIGLALGDSGRFWLAQQGRWEASELAKVIRFNGSAPINLVDLQPGGDGGWPAV